MKARLGFSPSWKGFASITFLAVLMLVTVESPAVVPVERRFDEAWKSAGYPGTIPSPDRIVNVRDFGALGNDSTDDAPAVLAARAALNGNPGVIFFPAGNYLIRSPLQFGSGVVLRGESATSAKLRFDFVATAITFAGSKSSTEIPFTASAAIHDHSVTVASTTDLAPGDWVLLTQNDDPAWNITDSWGSGSAGQICRITGITGNVLAFERPLRHDYPLTRNPRLRELFPARDCGIENLGVERTLAGDNTTRNNKHTLLFRDVAGGWVRGVHSRMAFGSHVSHESSTGVEITGCYFDDAHEFDGGGSGYGVRYETRSGECLLENNIFRRLRHAILLQAGPNGNVIAYNYSREGNSSDHPGYASDISLHGNYPYANLFEGNIVGHIWIDNSHNGANGPLNTFFRNRAEVAGFNINDTRADRQNVVGNELYRGNFLAQLVAGNGYRFLGTDHFTHGNNSTASGLQPAGTSTLSDLTYYLATSPEGQPILPAWWTLAGSLPIIGVPLPFSSAKTNPAKSRWDAGARLVVGPPSIAGQPASTTVDEGTSVNLSIAASGDSPLTFQWFKNGVPIPGQTNATFTLPTALSGNAGTYHATVTDPDGSVQTAAANVVVRIVDTDSDGISDRWEESWFPGDLTRMNATSNTDGDRLLDKEEWIAGSSPTDASSEFTPSVAPLPNIQGALRIEWPAVPGHGYLLEVSPDLTPGSWAPTTGLPRVADGPTMSEDITNPESRLFLRVRGFAPENP